MKARLFPLAAVLMLLGAGPMAGDDLSVTWPLPPLPTGTNPATYPVPRQDWLDHFQSVLKSTQGKKFDLIFDGDSITANWHGPGAKIWDQHYAKMNAYDFGVGGDRTEHLLWRLQHGQVDGMDPKLVVLMIGTNDIGATTPANIAEGTKACLAEYEKRCPDAHIVLMAVLPRSHLPGDPVRSLVAQINQPLANISDPRVTYIDIGPKLLGADGTLSPDMAPDFLHPREAGYVIWAAALQPLIDQYFPPAPTPPPASAPATPAAP